MNLLLIWVCSHISKINIISTECIGSVPLLEGVCMFSLCLRGFVLVSLHLKTMHHRSLCSPDPVQWWRCAIRCTATARSSFEAGGGRNAGKRVICMSKQQQLPLLCPCDWSRHHPEMFQLSSETSLKTLIVNVKSHYVRDKSGISRTQSRPGNQKTRRKVKGKKQSDPQLFRPGFFFSSDVVSDGRGWITELPSAVHTYIILLLCEPSH